MWLQCRDVGCLDELYKSFDWSTMDEAIKEKGVGSQYVGFDHMRHNYYKWFK